jgi:rRNA maturation endonuclease Nob1
MNKHSISDAFSTGLGLAMGLTTAQYISQIMKPQERIVKQIIICVKCGGKNPAENKFCGECGQALYPPPPIQCPRCMALMPPNMKFCGKCGSLLKKMERVRKKRK